MSENARSKQQAVGPFEALLRKSDDGIVILDTDGVVQFVNPAAARIFGHPEEELVGTDLGFPLVNGEKTEVEILNRHEGLRTVEMIATETRWYEKPVYLAVFRDITERLEAEEKYRLLAENTSDLIVVLENEQTVFISPSVESILGYTPQQFAGFGPLEIVHPEDRDRVAAEIAEKLHRPAEGSLRYVCRQRHADGTYRWIETAAIKRIVESGNAITVLNSRDISERVRTEAELKKAVEEKTYLLRELNHRVKNNLAIVTSLIGTKDAALGDSVDLADLKHRIEAIRIVHDRLYRSDEVKQIDVGGYLHDLLATVFSSLGDRRVAIENRVEAIMVETKVAIPLGLIVNEIATNAIKHGFDPDIEARFTVEMRREPEDGVCVLTLANSGRPFPENVDLNRTDSLGLRLVPLLVNQIGGTVDLERTPSATFTIRFPIEHAR
jgi:PAS domain S-box-containing protein